MAEKLKILELFAGTGSISSVFKAEGHEVFTVDFDPRHNPDLVIDILDFDISMLPWIPDVIWASPDCRTWSIASCGHHWNKDKTPKTKECEIGIQLLNKTLDIIKQLDPKYWFIENPRGLMRKYHRMVELTKEFFRHTVTYCQYGDTRMKPTDVWTNCDTWHPKPMCKNGAPCHTPAPRGSRTGTQGICGAVDRSRIPHELCKEIYSTCTARSGGEDDATD